jgi:hypothetical protein
MMKNQKLIISIALTILIIVSIAVIVYVNLPEPEKGTNPDENITNNETETNKNFEIFTWIYNSTETNFTLFDLEQMNPMTGQGRYIKNKLLPDVVEIEPTHNYTGLPIKSFLSETNDLPTNFTILVTANDGWQSEYTIDEVKGIVDIYDENGTIIENHTAIMILAYAEDGQYYLDTDPNNETGPLRIALIGNDNPVSSSNLWTKMVISIELVAQP